MTRPTDASIARAFWELSAQIDPLDSMPNDDLTFVAKVTALAAEFDAESPAGTARGSEEVMQVALDRSEEVDAVARGEEGKTSPLFLTERYLARVRDEAALIYDHCPKCTAHMPPGKHCSGPNCPLRK